MLTKKEIFAILTATLSIGTIVSIGVESIEEWQNFFFISIGTVFLVIIINIIAKKIIATHFESKIKISLWEFSRFLFYNPISKKLKNYKPHQKIKKPFPAGFFMPLIVKFLSAGLLNWMASLTFDVKGTIYRTARKHSMYQYSEVTEGEMAWIAFAGIFANLIFAILGYMINMPLFSKLNLTYAFYNTIPIGNLDGIKLFFGKKELFWVTAIIVSIGAVLSLAIL